MNKCNIYLVYNYYYELFVCEFSSKRQYYDKKKDRRTFH